VQSNGSGQVGFDFTKFSQLSSLIFDHTPSNTAKMAPSNLPAAFNATAQDIEMLLSAQCHIGSKNMQVHMEPYLWKTRPDGINVINIGKTWYVTQSEKSIA
jgi:small subunit ribosomal protein SAe